MPYCTWYLQRFIVSGDEDENNQSDVSNSDDDDGDEVVTLLSGHAPRPLDASGGK